MRVALFITCIGDSVLPGVGTATAEILEGVHGPRTLIVLVVS